MTSVFHEKLHPFNCFSVQGTGSSPTGPDLEKSVSDQGIRSPGRPGSSGLQVPGEPDFVIQDQVHLGEFPVAGFLPSKRPSIAPAEMSNTPR